MDGIREHHAAVIARAFKAAEIAAENLHAPKLPGLDRIPQPLRRRVEAEDMPHLQDASVLCRQFRQLLRLVRNKRDRLLHEYVFACLEELFADREMRLRGCDHDHTVLCRPTPYSWS